MSKALKQGAILWILQTQILVSYENGLITTEVALFTKPNK